MSIKSEAAEHAKSSRFYIANETFCNTWEAYINDNNGTVEGSFTSWAIYFHGALPKYDVTFQIKKASTTNGNILIPSKKNIREDSILLFANVSFFKESFVVRKKSFLDKIGMSTFKEINQFYSSNSKGMSANLEVILKYLAPHFEDKSIKEFFYNKSTKQFQITFNKLIDNPQIIEEIKTSLT